MEIDQEQKECFGALLKQGVEAVTLSTEMTKEKKSMDSMDVDISDGNNYPTPSAHKSFLVTTPVAAGSSGEGLPYAPEGWPSPGDKWKWRVGNRRCVSGHWLDRYLYPPPRFQKVIGGKGGFSSKLSVKEFVQKEFPDVDVDAFFASFIWRVPCADDNRRKDGENNMKSNMPARRSDVKENFVSGSTIGVEHCKAENKLCSPRAKARGYSMPTKHCDICCSEAGFCRDCCCILCCKTIDWAYGGYGFIRCEANVDDNYICGHVAHMDCALRCYMAGTVGGCMGLDVEYYCRRCDNKTDLMSHVMKLLRTCESLDSRDDVEKILNLGLCILRGSEQTRAKNLRSRIGMIMAKLKHGIHLNDIWKVDDNTSSGDVSQNGNKIEMLGMLDIKRNERTMDSATEVEPSQENDAIDGRAESTVYIASDYSNASVKLENEVDEVLQELKESQKTEYRIAEQKLYAQKDFLLSLYQQLDLERSELANPASLPCGSDYDALLSNVLCSVDQIKHEDVKLRKMMEVAKGFGRTPKSILNEYFGLPIDD